MCHGPPFPKSDPEVEAKCKASTKQENFPLEMHRYLKVSNSFNILSIIGFYFSFEGLSADARDKRDYVLAYDKIRHDRIANCNHFYNWSLINVDEIVKQSIQVPHRRQLVKHV